MPPARLFNLADEVLPVQVEVVQVEVLCWCGAPGRFNARPGDDERGTVAIVATPDARARGVSAKVG